MPIPPQAIVYGLTVGRQQIVEIARSLVKNIKLLIMDEPSAPLTTAEVDQMLEIVRTLRDEVLNRNVQILDYTAAIELIKDDSGCCAGAVLMNMETKELMVAKAKTVILATGGAGRLHYQGFPTSNHYGATADGLILAYRAGARLLYPDTLQYHPTGAAFPAQIYGALVTEKVRSIGAMLVNANGEAFMNPLETRDVSAASIIRECTQRGNGVKTPEGYVPRRRSPR